MDNIKFSIIVPVYNVKEYLNKCLDSILAQTYKNFEVIVVDDGSTDGSEKICDQYDKSDERIKVFHKKNGGLSDARNYGVKHISGDYLLFIDSDDYIENKLLERLNDCLKMGKVDLVRFGLNVVDEKGNLKYCSPEKNCINEDPINIIDQLISTKFLEPACFYCYNLEFFKKNNFKYEKEQQKAYDMLYHYDQFLSNCDFDKKVYKIMVCYLTESLICKSKCLKKADYIKFKDELKRRKIDSKIYIYNYKKLIKTIVAKINIDLYIKIFCR